MSSEDVNGNYPNETDDAPTFDSNEQLRRIRAKKAKMLEAKEIPNPNSSDGNKREYSVEDEYGVKEGQKRGETGTDNSGEPKSPLQ
jgi:hypothetical protein